MFIFSTYAIYGMLFVICSISCMTCYAHLRGHHAKSGMNSSIQEIQSIIENIEKLREKILEYNQIIEAYKYVVHTEVIKDDRGRDEQIKHYLEICPTTIRKYMSEIKDCQSKQPTILQRANMSDADAICVYIKSTTDSKYLVTNPPQQIKLSKNYIENLYKIYIYRVSMETELNKMIYKVLPTQMNETKQVKYPEIIELLDNMTESLYEDYADMLH